MTVPVGAISESCRSLLDVTRESLEMAIEKVRPGNRLFDICGTVEKHVVDNGFSVVREMVGHGIGTKLHEEPQIPNYVDRKNENPRLKEGMVLAIEPMVNLGRPEMKMQSEPLDGGDAGRDAFRALRAFGGGDVRRAVGVDQAVGRIDGTNPRGRRGGAASAC